MPGQSQRTDSPAFIITDDWAESLPITEEELELLEAEFLDIVTAMIQHG